METLKFEIMINLKEVGGFLPVSPSSKADKIKKIFGVRKKEFLEAVEALVQEGQIVATPGGIQTKVETPASGRMFRQVRRKRH